MLRVQFASAHVAQTVDGIVRVEFIEVLVQRAGDDVFSPQTVARATISVFDAVDVGRRAVVVPVAVDDAAKAVQSSIDVAGVRIVAAGRTDQRVFDVRLGVVRFDEGVLAEVAVIGQVRGRAVVVDDGGHSRKCVRHAVGRVVVVGDDPAIGVRDGGGSDRVVRAAGVAVLHLRCGEHVDRRRVVLIVGGELTEIVVGKLDLVHDVAGRDRRVVPARDRFAHASRFVAGRDAADRSVDFRIQCGNAVVSLASEFVEVVLVNGTSLIGLLRDLTLAVVFERDPVGAVDRVRVDYRPFQQAAGDFRIGQRRAVNVLGDLVSGGGILRRDFVNVAVGIVGRFDGHVGIDGWLAAAGRTR